MNILKDMTPKLIGETWFKFPNERSKCRYSYGIFECPYCGKEFEAQVTLIRTGKTRSCGCLSGQKHGLTKSRFYFTWNNMIRRCSNQENHNYINYGGRGITVCDEWLDAKTFIEWAESTHPNIEGLTLDRIDANGNYEPSNCRWADKTTQALNRRMRKTTPSGNIGVNYRKNKWISTIWLNKKSINLGSFLTKEEAVQARDNYIIENNLPHKLSVR